MIALTGFQPDLDPATPGVIVDCSNLIPTLQGMAADRALVAVAPALASACVGASYQFKTDGTFRQLAGTQTGLFELAGGAWSSVSRASGAYTGSADNRWRFSQLGNVTLATNGADALQFSNGSGVFADVAGAPKAKLVEVVAGCVLLFNTSASATVQTAGAFVPGVTYTITSVGTTSFTSIGASANTVGVVFTATGAGSGTGTATATSATGGDAADGWWASNLYDYTGWTPGLPGLAAYGRFLDEFGPVVAARRLGDVCVVYKNRALYVGQFVGSPTIWSWQQVSSKVGTVSGDGVVNIGTAHVFWSDFDSNFYVFDGSRPEPIGNDIRRWWMNDSNPAYRYKLQGLFDRQNGLVRFFYVSNSNSGSVPDHSICWHVASGKWGRSDMGVEAVCESASSLVTYDGYGSDGRTWDTVQGITFDSPLWLGGNPLPSVVNGSHVLGQLIGTPGLSGLVSGSFGADDGVSVLKRVWLHFLESPDWVQVWGRKRMSSGEPWSLTFPAATVSQGKADVLQAGRWHCFSLNTTGAMQVNGYGVEFGKGTLR